jgi:cysteine desulfurase
MQPGGSILDGLALPGTVFLQGRDCATAGLHLLGWPVVLYFDHNATSPLSVSARDAWLDAVARYPGNPSSPHRLGARASAALDGAREKLAGWLGCEPGSIVFTSGATESSNTILSHLARESSAEAWVSAMEHPCVFEPARAGFRDRLREIPVNPQGLLDLDWVRDGLRKARPAVVAVMAANNETGVCQPWAQVAELCQAHGVAFFCDAAQWIGKLPVTGLGACDYLTGCAHKFGGPQGVGFLRAGRSLHPLLLGGPHEEGQRAGTENVPGVLAMVAALEERLAQSAFCEERLSQRMVFEAGLSARLPGVEILGAAVPRLWNTVAAVLPQADCRQRWVVKLDKLGFAVSTGSACASGKEKTSHVLQAMGYAPEAASRVLRFSAGWDTAASDWQVLLDGIERAWAELQADAARHSVA